jgi:hypothetical protein
MTQVIVENLAAWPLTITPVKTSAKKIAMSHAISGSAKVRNRIP